MSAARDDSDARLRAEARVFRFSEPDLEQRYQSYRAAAAVQPMRWIIGTSIPAWLAAHAFFLWYRPDLPVVVGISALTIYPIFGWALLAPRDQAARANLLAILAPGLNIVLLAQGVALESLLATPMLLAILWVSVTITRLPVVQSVLVAGTYATSFLIVVVAQWLAGGLPWADALIMVLLVALVAPQALVVSVALDHDLRHAFLQAERIDEILHNTLPERVVRRLQAGETSMADSHPQVTVLFADIVGFTPLAQQMSADAVVRLLDQVFRRFDQALGGDIEKIKTIGDAYLAVGGLGGDEDHAERMVRFARRMLEEVGEVNRERGTELALRIGLATGPVVAGIIGERGYAYDLWGDTVNTAARMESHGIQGRIHLAGSTRDALADSVEVESRGEISVKGMGAMETYLVVDP